MPTVRKVLGRFCKICRDDDEPEEVIYPAFEFWREIDPMIQKWVDQGVVFDSIHLCCETVEEGADFDIENKIETPYKRMTGASGLLFLSNSDPKVKFCMELCPETGFHYEIAETYRFKNRLAKTSIEQRTNVWVSAENLQTISEELRQHTYGESSIDNIASFAKTIYDKALKMHQARADRIAHQKAIVRFYSHFSSSDLTFKLEWHQNSRFSDKNRSNSFFKFNVWFRFVFRKSAIKKQNSSQKKTSRRLKLKKRYAINTIFFQK